MNRTDRTADPADLAPGLADLARQQLERRLADGLAPARVALYINNNKYIMISIKRKGDVYHLRVHHMFLNAKAEIVSAMVKYITKSDPEASQVLSAYINANQAQIRRRQRRDLGQELMPQGQYFDLRELYSAVNRKYFNNAIQAQITWGKRAPANAAPRRRNSIKMGSYSVEEKLIRIHPSLDRAFVPRYFVEWIVYHEMLHQKHPIPVIDGRRIFHTEEFLAEERLFDEFERAQRWERVHLNRLLVY